MMAMMRTRKDNMLQLFLSHKDIAEYCLFDGTQLKPYTRSVDFKRGLLSVQQVVSSFVVCQNSRNHIAITSRDTDRNAELTDLFTGIVYTNLFT